MARAEGFERNPADYYFSYPDGSVLANEHPLPSGNEYSDRYLEYMLDEERLKVEASAKESGESLVRPESVVNLGRFLVNHSVAMPIDAGFYQKYRSSWRSMEDDIQIGAAVWISDITQPYIPPKSKVLSRNTLRRASSLGLIGSIKQITSNHRFGSLGTLYSLADLSETQRVGKWNSYGEDELAGALRQLSEELGRTPRWDDIKEKSQTDPNFPGPKVYKKVFGSVIKAQRASELVPIKDWAGRENYEFVEWGVKLAEANGGLLVSERLL
ncbi:MAG TPA: hypothetical protein VIK37_02540, partial [Candidatus Saccharimonadales bacterium]